MSNGLKLKKLAALSEGPNQMIVNDIPRGPGKQKAKRKGINQMNSTHVLKKREERKAKITKD